MNIEINSIDDFIILIENELKDAELFIRKEVFDSSIINDTTQEYLDFYKRKRKRIIKKFGDKSFLLRIEFKKEVEINKEDFEQLIYYPNMIYNRIGQLETSKKVLDKNEVENSIIKEKNKLQEFFLDRLKDLKNSIKLSYYNLRIETLLNDLEKNKQPQQIDPETTNQNTENYNKEYLHLFKEWGFELFEHLNKEFICINGESIKFTILYYFLTTEKRYFKGNKENYREFVQPYLINIKFSRFNFDSYNEDKYFNNLQELTNLYNDFIRAQNV